MKPTRKPWRDQGRYRLGKIVQRDHHFDDRMVTCCIEINPSHWFTSSAIARLDLEEKAIAINLLMLAWLWGSIPSDKKDLAQICHISERHFLRLWDGIAHLFEPSEDGKHLVETSDLRWVESPAISWSKSAYEIVYARDGKACRYCGSVENLAIDHVVPRCQGGSDDASNLVVSCKPCNSRKGGRTPAEAGMRLLKVVR